MRLLITCSITMLFLFAGYSTTVIIAADSALSAIEKDLLKKGLVDVQSLDKTIKVELKYSTTDNFLKKDVYGDLERCYLQKEAAEKLVKAQRYLREIHPDYSLLVYDGLRPRRIQRLMWKIVKGTKEQSYVANPTRGSIHNYGSAVDLTIVDENGKPLDMGTPFDYFGKLAEPRHEQRFLKEGKLALKHIKNRQLLRKVMRKAGFINIRNEWWHFNAFPKSIVKKKYVIVE